MSTAEVESLQAENAELRAMLGRSGKDSGRMWYDRAQRVKRERDAALAEVESLRAVLLTPSTELEPLVDARLYQAVSGEPTGIRDVYWCWVVNEPFIIGYDDQGIPRCSLCGWQDTESPDYTTAQVPTLSSNFLGSHTFVVHVHKPRNHEPQEGDTGGLA